jgi:predicted lipoprotein with Yx(FWY)xxD motif
MAISNLSRPVLAPLTVATAAFVFTACGGADATDDMHAQTAKERAAPVPTSTSSARSKPKRNGKTVKVMKTDYGRILVDGHGKALYLFTRDPRDKSRCDGACADAWPPFLTRGEPQVGDGATESLLGTSTRSDGKRQVTYRGRPLYYYVGDREPGQVLCQDVEEFGGHWYVVRSNGKAVRGNN